MMKQHYKTILMNEYGYPEAAAELTADQLLALDEECLACLEDIVRGKPESDLRCGDYSVRGLMSDYNLNAYAAVVAISQLRQDYDRYSRMLRKGIK